MKTTDCLVVCLAALVASLLTATPRLRAQAGTAIDDPEAYAVYASVLPARFDSGDTDRTRVALLQETRAKMQCFPESGSEWSTVVESYKTQNARVRTLQPGFNLGLAYTLVSLADLNSLMAKPPGTRPFARFPNGKILSLSAVGFDDGKTRAIVTVQFECGFGCSGGSHLLREKNQGRWVQPPGNTPACSWIS